MSSSRDRTQHIEPLPPNLLATPLDYILSDHLRQRVLCHLCDSIADTPSLDVAMIEEVIAYLAHDMVIHVIDEEQDLFPLLRRRAESEDEIDAAIGKLSGEHANDELLAGTILTGLRTALGSPAAQLPDDTREALRTFANNLRHHLALENATVIPLAKVRLGARDLANLAARMAARRGVLLEPDGGDA